MRKGTGIEKVSIEEIFREIHARQRRRPALERRRARLAAKLATIDAELAVLRRETGRKDSSGKRGQAGTLESYLKQALIGKQMRVPQLIEAVKGLGYQTSSPNFRTIVSAKLCDQAAGFKRVARGVYTVE